MRKIALIELLICCAIWLTPLTWRALRRNPQRTHVERDPLSRWGFWMQVAAYALVAMLFPTKNPGNLRILAAMMFAPMAVWLTWWAAPNLGRQWSIFAGLYDDHQLVRTGPYRYLRHPIYASMLLVFAALAALKATLPGLLVSAPLFFLGTEIRVRAEDRLLGQRFGAAFEQYCRSTRAYVPLLR